MLDISAKVSTLSLPFPYSMYLLIVMTTACRTSFQGNCLQDTAPRQRSTEQCGMYKAAKVPCHLALSEVDGDLNTDYRY